MGVEWRRVTFLILVCDEVITRWLALCLAFLSTTKRADEFRFLAGVLGLFGARRAVRSSFLGLRCRRAFGLPDVRPVPSWRAHLWRERVESQFLADNDAIRDSNYDLSCECIIHMMFHYRRDKSDELHDGSSH